MLDDPVVQRVRKARHAISEQYGHDSFKLVQYYMQRQQAHKERIREGAVQAVPHPEERN